MTPYHRTTRAFVVLILMGLGSYAPMAFAQAPETAPDASAQTLQVPDDQTAEELEGPAADESAIDETASTEAAVVEAAPLEPEEPPAPIDWPGLDRLAEALADAEGRDQALLTMAALLTLRDMPAAENRARGEALARQFFNHREWLDDLNRRYGYAQARSPVVDPAAWQVQVQLDRVDLRSSQLSSPLGPGHAVIVERVFNQAQPALAAASLPDLLWLLEADATMAWATLLPRLNNDVWLSAALMAQGADFFAWPEAQPVADPAPAPAEGEPAGFTAQDRLLARHRESIGAMLGTAAGTGPPDPRRLQQLRRELLLLMPELDHSRRTRAASLVHLAGLVDGLYRHEYLHFTESLLAISAQLEIDAPVNEVQTQRFAAWLAEILPAFSASYGRALSAVDPRLNSVIATTYDVVRTLAQPVTREQRRALRLQIADAVARLALLVPDIGFYFDIPVRDPIAGGVDACTGIAGELDPDGTPSMTRELFDDCQRILVELADVEARQAQLAGDADGPFGPLQLRRELNLTAGQRINYGIGYLHDRYATGCVMPEQPLPNPLEWAYLATFMVWFAEQSPVFFQTQENEQRLQRMRAIGDELVRTVSEQVDCLAGAGAVINDPVDRVTSDYRGHMNAIGTLIEEARVSFREETLKPGADVRLDGESLQSTGYRPDSLTIGPCDMARACEMTGTLSATRALTGLFDDVYLVADQSGMGEVQICYDNMEWVDRRLVPVREGDENVANYFGHLGFDLRGQYVDESGATDLFAFRFTSPQEHHYMFAASSEEVLNDACPTEWIGTRIVTPMPEGSPRIVPDRLTYLSAPRTLPSRLLSNNWENGAEWRDWFVTGIGVEEIPLPDAPDIGPRLTQYLAALYRQEQNTVYGALLNPPSGPFSNTLNQDLERLETSKLLLRNQMMLFFPHILTHSDPLREAVAGNSGMLDRRIIGRFKQQDVPADDMLVAGFERLEQFQRQWRSLPEAVRRNGSIADSVAHALVRLDAIYTRFFAEEQPASDPLALPAGPLGGAPGEAEEEDEAQ